MGFIIRQMQIGYERASTKAVHSSKKISVGEAFLNASRHQNCSASFSINPISSNMPYQRSLSVHNTAQPPSPRPMRIQAKRSVVDFSKSAAERLTNAKRGLTLD